MSCSPTSWALIADDLSGAADAAVEFLEAGITTEVCLTVGALASSTAELCAVSTASRELPGYRAAPEVTRWASAVREAGREVVFHKIDSMLRGNVAAENAALVRSGDFAGSVICPALPRLGRVCRAGVLHTRDGVTTELPSGPGVEAPDAESEDDLTRIAGEALRRGLLVAGSSGIAKPYARALAARASGTAQPGQPTKAEKPALLLIGSRHPRTLRQMEFALAEGRVEEGSLADIGDREPGRSTLIRVPMGELPAGWRQDLRRVIEGGRFGSLVLSGGSTAELVFHTLGVEAVAIGGATTPGAPWSRLRGGVAGGMTAVTKSGGFGNTDELVRILAKLVETGSE